MYDLIGDLHGHADELEQLLHRLGYRQIHGVYRHPERKVLFLGDFIDRGPKIREVLQIVRSMVEDDAALAVMGNHEWNALAFHTEDPESPGEFLRRHTPGNVRQISRTVDQLSPAELSSYLEWFRTLPMWLDLDGLRAIHACWDDSAIGVVQSALAESGGVTTDFLKPASTTGAELYYAVEVILKGKEAALPDGVSFLDKDGSSRVHVRTRWYLSPVGHTYHSYAFETAGLDCHHPLENTTIAQSMPYPTTAKPVFIGHYWLPHKQPQILTHNVACLDFSVAKGGFLCAYRWDGEEKLSNSNFVRVDVEE
ncbi:metallophosphoesterase [Schlesneria sp.]|uniref:metallophosphoesterase n=1 Tax=Schlesneria sp. TaxID=2762018 RepID=UPI002EF4A258